MNRRSFLIAGTASVAAAAQSGGHTGAAQDKGAQRLPVSKLQDFEKLGYGMFIHFGMSTFVVNELPDGKAPAQAYNPDRLDVDQWIQVVRDAGMKYAVLTTKHVAGHCLWPSRQTDYTVTNSGNKTDVLDAFVKACQKHKIMPGFYYCSWDNHNLCGSVTWSATKQGEKPYTTSLYQDFQSAQITELLSNYGVIGEVWIDIPDMLGQGYRQYLYEHIARLQPGALIMMNSGISDQAEYDFGRNWPSDLIAIERHVPPPSGHKQWREYLGKRYYMPGEVCDPIGKDWFYVERDQPRPDNELLDLYSQSRERGANLLLDVGPDQHGLICDRYRSALLRLSRHVRG